MKVANYQVLLSKYDFLSWDKMSQFIDKLPKEHCKEMKYIMVEGQLSAYTLCDMLCRTCLIISHAQ